MAPRNAREHGNQPPTEPYVVSRLRGERQRAWWAARPLPASNANMLCVPWYAHPGPFSERAPQGDGSSATLSAMRRWSRRPRPSRRTQVTERRLKLTIRQALWVQSHRLEHLAPDQSRSIGGPSPMTLDAEIERREPTRIHLLWKGPHTFGDVLEMDGGTDFGIYQVYGPHPAGGTESLLYIGQANDQTFAARFRNRDHRWWNPDSDDGVHGKTTPRCCGSSRDGFTRRRMSRTGAASTTSCGERTSTWPRSCLSVHTPPTGTNRASPASRKSRPMSTTTATS